MAEQEPTGTDDFVQRLTRHQGDLLAFVFALVGDWADAEEVLQETNTRLWEQRADYDVTRSFMPWARTIAHYMILAQRTRKRREKIQFNQDVVDLLAAEMYVMADELDRRQASLGICLEKLNPSARRLVDLCYAGGQKIRDAARQIGKSEAATYKSLARIRKTLHDCVEQQGEGVSV